MKKPFTVSIIRKLLQQWDDVEISFSRMVELMNKKAAETYGWIDISTTKQFPKENETVWLYNANDNFVWLGCHVYVPDEGWFWAVSNDQIYAEDGKIITEAEVDDCEITHWCALPSLPKKT